MQSAFYLLGLAALAGPVFSIPTPEAAAASTGCAGPAGLTEYAGMNIAGFDFGCDTNGKCATGGAYPPLGTNGSPNGPAQMKHFVNDDKLNVFRLPIGWQYLVSYTLGGTLNATVLAEYDVLVNGCTATGASCIVDIHNYARWDGGIIGQGGPTNAQFASLWSQLASHYKGNPKIFFGLMNEPHDLDVPKWAATVQEVVTAIRKAGATSNTILLPGTGYTSAGSFTSSGSFAALGAVKNLDGSTTDLVFDVHKYLDGNGSGTDPECVTNNVAAFTSLAADLKKANREAFLTETGGGDTASCEKLLCEEIAYLNANSDVYIGYVGWAAGSFQPTAPLSLTPSLSGSTYTDHPLVSKCIKRS